MYHQVLSVMTLSQLTRIFDQKKGYDLRKMIAGSERLLDSLANDMENDPAPYMLSGKKKFKIIAAVCLQFINIFSSCSSTSHAF